MIVGNTLLLLFHMAVSVALDRFVKPKRDWADGTETMLTSGALASGFVMIVHRIVTDTNGTMQGHHHAHKTSAFEANLMTAISLGYLAVAILLTGPLTRRQDAAQGYWAGRSWQVVVGFIGLLPYYSL